MRSVIAYSLFALLPVCAQEVKFPESFEKLAAKAVETVDVTLDSSMLQLAGNFLSTQKPGQARAKELVGGLKGIYVKSFEFAKEGEYSEADVEAIRSQLSAPDWSKIVSVQSKKKGENVGVYVKREGNQIVGLTVLSAEPKELTIVNIVGPIDVEQLSRLGGQFGIPKVDVKQKEKPPKSEEK